MTTKEIKMIIYTINKQLTKEEISIKKYLENSKEVWLAVHDNIDLPEYDIVFQIKLNEHREVIPNDR